MKLGYTEFSFGYAFTENLIRSASTATGGAPYFPNLIQEGRLGYDVRVDFPGVPLYLQYKLPELMVRDTAGEISKHSLQGIATPFFRMHLMKRSVSRQHQLLMDLERGNPHSVYYATPELRSNASFNAAYNSASVHLRSALFSPNDIGGLPDDDSHVVAYREDLQYAWFCSKPARNPCLQIRKYRRSVAKVVRRAALSDSAGDGSDVFGRAGAVGPETASKRRECDPATHSGP